MTKMTEEDFDKLVASTTPEKCDHKDIVKLYYLGTHTDYGCIKCKCKSSNKEDYYRIKHLI